VQLTVGESKRRPLGELASCVASRPWLLGSDALVLAAMDPKTAHVRPPHASPTTTLTIYARVAGGRAAAELMGEHFRSRDARLTHAGPSKSRMQ